MSISGPPSSSSQLWLVEGNLTQQWVSLEKRVTGHPFNHAVELLVPGTAQLPSTLSLPPPHYYTSHLPLSHFVQPELIGRYLRDGSFVAVSMGTKVDTDNVFAVLPSGKLLLSIDKDTHEQLGLQGKPSCFQKHRFLVEVDLTAPAFTPEKPNYDRVQWCLSGRLGLEADFTIAWAPKEQLSESQFQLDFKAQKWSCVTDGTEVLHNFPLPVANGEHPCGQFSEDGVASSCSAADFHTWLGAVSCGVDASGGLPGDFVSTFASPKPHSICQYGIRTRWTGMVHSSYTCTLIKSIREYLDGSEEGPPWIAVNVWGFEDAPISWTNCEHGWYQSGDNHYSVVLFATGHFWCMSALGTHDIVQ